MSRDMDHAVLLQTERSLDHLSDRVEKLEEKVDGHNELCDCNCAEDGLDGVGSDVEDLQKELKTLRERFGELLQIMLEHMENCP